MTEARASILLPAFNAASTLPICLKSIQRQSEMRWECVVVDDGSSDETSECVRSVARGDPRFKLISAPHRGLVGALNQGLECCSSPLIARMDADDVMHRDRLALQCRMLECDPGLAAVGAHVRLFPRDRLRDGFRDYERWLNSLEGPADVARDAYVECPIAHPTLMIRRALLESRGYRDRGWAEDYDLILWLLSEGHRVGVVSRRLLGWRDSPARLSRTGPAYRIERFVACKAWYLAKGFLESHERYVLWGYGPTGRAMYRSLEELGKTPSHIVEVNPRKIGQVIHGAPVIPVRGLLELAGHRVIVAVAGAGPRALIREEMSAMGFVELEHFVCTA